MQNCWGGHRRISWAHPKYVKGPSPLSTPVPNPQDAKQATTRENQVKPHFYEVVQASGGRGPQVSQGLIITLALGFRGAPWCESALYFQLSSGSHTVSWTGGAHREASCLNCTHKTRGPTPPPPTHTSPHKPVNSQQAEGGN